MFINFTKEANTEQLGGEYHLRKDDVDSSSPLFSEGRFLKQRVQLIFVINHILLSCYIYCELYNIQLNVWGEDPH